MSNHGKTEDVPKTWILTRKVWKSASLDSWETGTMEVLKNCLKFDKTEDVPSKTWVPTSLEEILIRFWRFPILQVGKRIHFLFSPLSFLATKSEEFIGKVSLSFYSEVVFLDYTFLDLLRTLGRLGMRNIYVLHWDPFSFVCSVHYHSLIFTLGHYWYVSMHT